MNETYGLNGTYAVPDWDGIRDLRAKMDPALFAGEPTPKGDKLRRLGKLREVEATALRAARMPRTRYDEGGTE